MCVKKITLTLFTTAMLHAEAITIPAAEKFSFAIADRTEIWREQPGKAGLDYVRKSARFEKLSGHDATTLTGPVWFRFNYTFSKNPQNIILSLYDFRITRFDLFVLTRGNILSEKHHDAAQFSQRREMNSREYLVQLPAESAEVYVRIESRSEIRFNPHLLSWDTWLAHEDRYQTIFGFFYGVQAILILLSLFLFMALRERQYIFFALYLAAWLVFEIAAKNFLSLQSFYEWPENERHLPVLWIFFAQSFFLLFARAFLNLKVVLPRAGRITLTGSIFFAAAALVSAFFYRQPAVLLAGFSALAVFIFVFGLSLYIYRLGFHNSRYLIVALLAAFCIVLFYALLHTDTVTGNRLSVFLVLDFSIPTIITLTAIIFSFALADRYRLLYKEKIQREHRFAAELQEEKKRISAELHDVIGSDLATLAMRVSDDASTAKNDEIGSRLYKILERLRELVTLGNLDPELSRRLPHDLKERAQEIAAFARLELTCRIDEMLLASHDAFHLQRFYYEALTNTARHAQARRLQVRLRERHGRISLTIADDGSGFSGIGTRTGNGLQNLAERARRIQARFRLVTRSGKGTCVALLFRIEAHERSGALS